VNLSEVPQSMPVPIDTPLIRLGESFHSELRFTREQIEQFARLSGDTNPLHFDRLAAERANFGEVIASGQQTASHMMGLVASHFSRRSDGIPREMLCLNFNFAFKAPVFAEQLISIHWRVSNIESSHRRGGFIGHVDGHASVAGKPCVIGRGTVLVTRAAVAVMA
jgi:acyl dehydratase